MEKLVQHATKRIVELESLLLVNATEWYGLQRWEWSTDRLKTPGISRGITSAA